MLPVRQPEDLPEAMQSSVVPSASLTEIVPMAPAHHRTPGGGTGGSRRVPLPKHYPFFRQGIDIGGLHRGWLIDIVASHILPA